MMLLQAPPISVPWWMDHIAVPILFTLFGALLGFAVGWLKDRLEDRKAKTAFLKAIRMELQTLRNHIKGSLKDAVENKEQLEKGERQVLHLVTAFQTTIYSSQLTKLKDLSDPLVLEAISFYSDLSNLEIVKSHLASRSFELVTLTETEAVKEEGIVTIYRSALDETIKRMQGLLSTLESLVTKLPN